MALLNYAQTAVRGDLFSSPHYVPFTLHYIVLASVAAYLQSEKVYRFTAWYFLISFFSWALIVRRFLGTSNLTSADSRTPISILTPLPGSAKLTFAGH